MTKPTGISRCDANSVSRPICLCRREPLVHEACRAAADLIATTKSSSLHTREERLRAPRLTRDDDVFYSQLDAEERHRLLVDLAYLQRVQGD